MVNKSMSLHRIQWWLFWLGEIIKRFWGGEAGGKERVVSEKWAPSSPPSLRSDLHFPAHCSTSHHVRPFHALPPKPNPSGTYGLAKDVLTRPEAFMVMRLVWSKNLAGSWISFLSHRKLFSYPCKTKGTLGSLNKSSYIHIKISDHVDILNVLLFFKKTLNVIQFNIIIFKSFPCSETKTLFVTEEKQV